MSGSASTPSGARARREPPPFRRVEVARVQRLSGRMVGLTFAGAELEGLAIDRPAASVRLLVPSPGSAELVMPQWNGNEFLLPDGERPTIRTFTPRRLDPDALELEVWVVIHDGGEVSDWARGATSGDPAAVSGPGRGYEIDPDASAFLLAGDETAIPAISQLLEALPGETPAEVHIEVADHDARLPLPEHPRVAVHWWVPPSGAPPGEALAGAVTSADVDPGTRVWAAGEAAVMQRLRRHFLEDLEMPSARVTIRGYWKRGR